MENKTTTELLELLYKTEKKAQESDSDNELWNKVDEITEELHKRPPFDIIFGEEFDMSLNSLFDEITSLKEDIKLLKRHKHDDKSNDVLIRI